ncbi:GntR family transcriptional regulator [Jiella avicenniae]|uniref:GntR family transcriptional regulator n=1 Tax=Jiella avicenniae TaxID=2907202 RepID=A0A9X1P3M1_9HYPH|nr:GntR family transcriptional regulator [Jiella avicenniae]MCE7029686.1 GntR family transcriptional regulator [Jiella avicenniae]
MTKTTFIDSAYDAILHAILTQKFRPGDRLRSKVLAETLSISRTPIERALERLSGEGLVEFKPGAGPFVAAPSIADVLELYDLRDMLELYGTAYAVGRLDAGYVAALEEANGRFKAVAASKSPDLDTYIAMSHADRDFHLRLLSNSPGAQLSEVYNQITTRIMMAQFARFGAYFREGAIAEHDVILDAIRSGEVGRIATAVHDHVEAARSGFLARAGEHALGIDEFDHGALKGKLMRMYRSIEDRQQAAR